MERNWLIRTNQKQILGPVGKTKVIEFLQKGALGLNDEVMCGNGYWFSIKEKDLVDKYLYGDVPQSYNPISDSKSVLCKRENPDKTMSLNATPANMTSVLKIGQDSTENMPINSDLEYPDITFVFNTTPVTNVKSVSQAAYQDETKLPNPEDLEFPDISLIKAAIENAPKAEIHQVMLKEMKIQVAEKVEVVNNDEPMVYPTDEDLDYPDLTPKPLVKNSAKDFKYDLASDSDLTLIVNPEPPKEQNLKAEKIKPSHLNTDEKKLLHERKAKVITVPVSNKEEAKLPRKVATRTPVPENLKKQNDNYLLYILVILILIIVGLFFYYYSSILNKPFPV
jgi:hypothetical protein